MTELAKMPNIQELASSAHSTLEFLTFLGQAEEVPVEGIAICGQLMKEAHESKKDLEKTRKRLTKPWADAKKALDAEFRKITEPLTRIVSTAKSIISRHEQQERQRLMEAVERGEITTTLDFPKESVVRTQKYWTYRVTDIRIIPRCFLQVDDGAIKNLMKDENPEELDIPGIVFEQAERSVIK